MHAAKAWLTNDAESEIFGYRNRKRPEDVTAVATAIAHKLGTTPEAEIAAAAARAKKRNS